MKKIFQYLSMFLAVALLVTACQDLDEPELSAYPLDGPVITFLTPNSNGSSVIQTLEPVASITIKFSVQDDKGIASISVKYDDNEIANMSNFTNNQLVNVDDLVYDNVTTGPHIITITAIDSDGESSTQTAEFNKVQADPYTPVFGEALYMPFDDNFYDLVTQTPANETGSPGYAGDSKAGSNAYVAGTDNYLTFPANGLTPSEFSATFWYKVDASPDRSGIISIGNENGTEDRTQGFRLFREGSATEQRIKLNVGTGTGESWNDGDVIDVAAGEWVHIAITISTTQSTIYFNGEPVNTANMSMPISWNGCNNFTIGAGGSTFSYWGHLSDNSAMDELRFFDSTLTQAEILNISGLSYQPILNSETLYMPFDGSYTDRISLTNAAAVGSPSFAGESYSGNNSYKGATDSYLNFPINGLFGAQEFSAVFWYKVDATPDRSGLLVVGDNVDDRFQGFRLFREGSATNQRIKLNVGTGTDESWNDGGEIDVAAGNWVQVAFTVSPTESNIYFNGVLQNTGTLSAPVDWTGCSNMVIGSGGPTFSYWGHLSDLSAIDELRTFNIALTQTEIQGML